jgi:hypothetical protein
MTASGEFGLMEVTMIQEGRSRPRLAAWLGVVAAVLVVACGGSAAPAPASGSPPATGATLAAGSGASMCDALTADDFKAQGLRPDRARPDANVQDRGASAYCVYAGRSSATGGLELDVFYPVDDPAATMDEVMGEFGPNAAAASLAGADAVRIATSVRSGGPLFGVIAVQRGNLVFILGVPTSSKVRDQLTALSTTALHRLSA